MTEPKEFYEKCYDILVSHAGAIENDRDGFILHFTGDQPPTEWRFGGYLGFGGKFRRNNGRIYIDCYPEDLSKKAQKIIDLVNQQLDGLVAEFWPEKHARAKALGLIL